jgi:chloramphenicol-sensitive protein RarD
VAEPETSATYRQGVVLAVTAYALWGAFPLYFQLVSAAGPVEIIGHRVLWSFVFCFGGILVLGQWKHYAAVVRDKRLFWGLAGAGVLVSVNWLVYVWAVVNDHIVDAALGYFVNPLVTVALAVLVLRERLRTAQRVAVGIALTLAGSFGLYGLVKNRVGGKVSPLVGLTVETTLLAPVALGYLGWLQMVGQAQSLSHGPVLTVLLIAAGIVTAVPLLLFAGASSRIPLSMMGLIQYMTPVIQFAFGVWINHETMSLGRWIGFGLVWVALVVLTADSLKAARTRGVIAPELMD